MHNLLHLPLSGSVVLHFTVFTSAVFEPPLREDGGSYNNVFKTSDNMMGIMSGVGAKYTPYDVTGNTIPELILNG